MTSTVNHLQLQIAKITAVIKTTSWGRWHGHLATVLYNAEYRSIMGNPDIVINCLQAPPIVPIRLTNNMMLTNRANITGIHNLACQEYWKQEATNRIIINKIVSKAINPTYIKELEDNYIGYRAGRPLR